jgi:TusA-related sulfurtransferase
VSVIAMSVFGGIGLVVVGLVLVAACVLAFDLFSGHLGGARHTMERARRLLVIATDEETSRGADRWIEQQRKEHPRLQCFVLVEPEGQGLFAAVEEVIERERPDALVMVEHGKKDHSVTLERLREQLEIPIDTIPAAGNGATA